MLHRTITIYILLCCFPGKVISDCLQGYPSNLQKLPENFSTDERTSSSFNYDFDGYMMNGPDNQCPIDCAVQLSSNNNNILFKHPNQVSQENEINLYCAKEDGFCGATVPLYRHYRLDITGIQYIYSSNSSVIDSYIRELFPFCYVWAQVKISGSHNAVETEMQNDTCTVHNNIPSDDLVNLNIYKVTQGFYTDHYLTTLEPEDPQLERYELQGTFGKVLLLEEQATCSCLIKLKQQVETQHTAPFERSDHRLVTEDTENMFYENYEDNGETFYCVKHQACGATIPLYKFFHIVQLDTFYAIDPSPVLFAILQSPTPLCYLWSASYNISSTTSTEHSTIANPMTVLNDVSDTTSTTLVDIPQTTIPTTTEANSPPPTTNPSNTVTVRYTDSTVTITTTSTSTSNLNSSTVNTNSTAQIAEKIQRDAPKILKRKPIKADRTDSSLSSFNDPTSEENFLISDSNSLSPNATSSKFGHVIVRIRTADNSNQLD